jgi:hypothetical protein
VVSSIDWTIEIYESWRTRDAEFKEMAKMGEGLKETSIEEQRPIEEKEK